MSGIENTSTRDAELNLLGILAAGQSNYIEGMEAAGQQQFVHSDLIPTDSPAEELAALGFVLGDQVPDDDLFRKCTLPNGWAKQATDHSMGSNIVDEFGRKRVGVFYKAAFYDRRASAHVIQLSGYLMQCMWDGVPVVYDDTWATPQAVEATAEAAAASARQRAAKYASYYPAGVDRQNEEARNWDAIAEAARGAA